MPARTAWRARASRRGPSSARSACRPALAAIASRSRTPSPGGKCSSDVLCRYRRSGRDRSPRRRRRRGWSTRSAPSATPKWQKSKQIPAPTERSAAPSCGSARCFSANVNGCSSHETGGGSARPLRRWAASIARASVSQAADVVALRDAALPDQDARRAHRGRPAQVGGEPRDGGRRARRDRRMDRRSGSATTFRVETMRPARRTTSPAAAACASKIGTPGIPGRSGWHAPPCLRSRAP